MRQARSIIKEHIAIELIGAGYGGPKNARMSGRGNPGPRLRDVSSALFAIASEVGGVRVPGPGLASVQHAHWDRVVPLRDLLSTPSDGRLGPPGYEKIENHACELIRRMVFGRLVESGIEGLPSMQQS